METFIANYKISNEVEIVIKETTLDRFGNVIHNETLLGSFRFRVLLIKLVGLFIFGNIFLFVRILEEI